MHKTENISAEIFAVLLNMNKKFNNLTKVNGVAFLGRILEGVFCTEVWWL